MPPQPLPHLRKSWNSAKIADMGKIAIRIIVAVATAFMAARAIRGGIIVDIAVV